MLILEQIGSYAGLAAILGLAVLAALYFSQARDLRRLREEAEERSAAPAPAPTVRPVARPTPQKPEPAAVKGAGPAQRPASRPASSPAPAKPGGAAPAPAAAASAGAAPAAPTAAASAAPPAAGKESPDGRKEGAVAAQAKPSAPPVKPPPPPAPQPAARRPTPIGAPPPPPGQPRTLRASTGTPGRPPWYRRIAPRYLALMIVGVLILGLGVAYGVVALVGEEPPATTTATEATDRDARDRGGSGGSGGGAPVDPSDVVVSILNGTNVPGLAAEIGDTIEAAGFQRGNVTNASNQESAESVVLYVGGDSDAAREVGRELDISQIQPIDSENQSLAGDATVVVIVGADQAE